MQGIMKRGEKKLFTPGPLGCSESVKFAMLRDLGSRDKEFIDTICQIREELLNIAGVSSAEYTTVLLQGSGTFAVEAVLQCSTPPITGKVLILLNGAYGKRMKTICDVSGIGANVLAFPETQVVNIQQVEEFLKSTEDLYSTVAVVHCETSCGILNPVEELGKVVKRYQPTASYFVDAMSSFGAVSLDFHGGHIDFMVSSANKCLQGVPGFAFVVAKKEMLLKCRGNCRSLSLDIVDQYESMELNGQFRFTPPTHTLLAFHQALKEFKNEGALRGRSARYQENCIILQEGMEKLGFKKLYSKNDGGYIITPYLYPEHDNFDFTNFYTRLNDLDQVIYPGKVTNANCFRIGSIGHLFPEDMKYLVICIEQVLNDMGIPVPLS